MVVEGGGEGGRWWWKVVVVVEDGGGYKKLGRILGRRAGVRACHPCFCNLPVFNVHHKSAREIIGGKQTT